MLTGICGETSTGKSTSLRNFDPKETYVINVGNKPLPWGGSLAVYSEKNKNYVSSNDYNLIINTMEILSTHEKFKHIKRIVIDDFQYIMGDEFMDRASEVGYNKFTEIGVHANKVIQKAKNLRDDLFVHILTHPEKGDNGDLKMKTVGRLMDNYITLDSLFTVLLYADVSFEIGNETPNYRFVTNRTRKYPAKSPMGMFKDIYIPNDLNIVEQRMHEFYYQMQGQQA